LGREGRRHIEFPSKPWAKQGEEKTSRKRREKGRVKKF
jgi:hypothetical protein